MNVLMTGAFGNVGLSALTEMLYLGYKITVFEINNRRNRQLAKRYRKKVAIIWGDLRNGDEVRRAVAGQDVVVHLAAIIPPLADIRPDLARAINVGGTTNILQAIREQEKSPKLIYTSSVAIYGDRLNNPMIEVTDMPNPNMRDEYAKQKLECEQLIRGSGVVSTIFRLTYIVSPHKLKMDTLMFEMPLETSIEICDTKDTGLAIANAVGNPSVWGETFHIAGGSACRITFGDYLGRMFEMFGFGKFRPPREAFSARGYHCGYMNTEKSENILQFQKHNLDDYFRDVWRVSRVKRFFVRLFRPIVKLWLLRRSPYYRQWRRSRKQGNGFPAS